MLHNRVAVIQLDENRQCKDFTLTELRTDMETLRKREAKPLLAFDDKGLSRLRVFVFDPVRSSNTERQTLVAGLREALTRLGADS
jgi:hypothetical protein